MVNGKGFEAVPRDGEGRRSPITTDRTLLRSIRDRPLDDLPPPDAFVSFVVGESSAAEDGGQHPVQLVLTVSEGSLITPVTVGLVDQGLGDATPGVDYVFAATPVVFATAVQ